MRTNYSKETNDTVLISYEFRIEALLNKINFLEAQLEVSKLMNFNH